VTIGAINADVIKDLCLSLVTKDMKETKIDLALKSILQQHTFYPLYPGNPRSPIEWEKFS